MQRAFSLVELSIVLVILGLLTGGILGGQALIRASELRSVSADFGRYQAAVNAFRDKYFQLPGDFSQATRFWAAAASCATTTVTTTCNGSGNGVMDPGEGQLLWQHLAMAGLIEGSYDGRVNLAAGTSQPKAKLANAYYSIPYDFSSMSYHGFESGAYSGRAVLAVGKAGYSSLNFVDIVGAGGVLKQEEAWNIDKKMDDGLPKQGAVQSYLYDWVNFAATDDGDYCGATNSNYLLNDTTHLCPLGFAIFR
jgi:prepilin-type N-terminal cleavage/methylation domain-containing protein